MKALLSIFSSLRADHVGCYGYGRDTTPTVDSVGRRGFVFERAYPSDVPTFSSLSSLLLGLPGTSTGLLRGMVRGWPPGLITLGQAMAGSHSTAAVIPGFPLLAPGFHAFFDPAAGLRSPYGASAEQVNAAAMQWLREHYAEDFFLVLFYPDPHVPHEPPEGGPGAQDPDREGPSLEAFYGSKRFSENRASYAWLEGFPDLQYAVAAYDSEVRRADSSLGEMLSLLEELGIRDETLVVLTSDHGENLGEHGLFFSHEGLYDAAIRVPLVIDLPSSRGGGKRFSQPVETRQIYGALLALAGLRRADEPSEVLLRLLQGETPEGEGAVTTQVDPPGRSLVKGGKKFIQPLEGKPELYDLEVDPGELHDLSGQLRELAEEMRASLTKAVASMLSGRRDTLGGPSRDRSKKVIRSELETVLFRKGEEKVTQAR
ncbi:MAG: sulfatase [TACK group archaeon]|nr:sulfatase [TACK group archaeon]